MKVLLVVFFARKFLPMKVATAYPCAIHFNPLCSVVSPEALTEGPAHSCLSRKLRKSNLEVFNEVSSFDATQAAMFVSVKHADIASFILKIVLS